MKDDCPVLYNKKQAGIFCAPRAEKHLTWSKVYFKIGHTWVIKTYDHIALIKLQLYYICTFLVKH